MSYKKRKQSYITRRSIHTTQTNAHNTTIHQTITSLAKGKIITIYHIKEVNYNYCYFLKAWSSLQRFIQDKFKNDLEQRGYYKGTNFREKEKRQCMFLYVRAHVSSQRHCILTQLEIKKNHTPAVHVDIITIINEDLRSFRARAKRHGQIITSIPTSLTTTQFSTHFYRGANIFQHVSEYVMFAAK